MLNWGSAKQISNLSILCLLFLFTASCSSEPDAGNLGERLCAIYRSVMTEEGSDKNSSFDQAIKLSEKIEDELPDYYANHHVNIVAASPEDQYPMISMVIKHETGEPWDCPEAAKRLMQTHQ